MPSLRQHFAGRRATRGAMRSVTRSVTRSVVLSAVFGAALVALACSSTGSLKSAIERSQEKEQNDQSQIMVIVENRGFWEITVYAVPESGIRTRVGSVGGNKTDTLRASPTLVAGGQAVVFWTEPIGGGRRQKTEKLYLSPGDEITLMVPPSQ